MQRRSRRVLRKRGDGSRGPRTSSRSSMADLPFSRSKSPPSCPRASMRCGNEHSLLVRYVGAIFLQAAFGRFVALLAQSLSAPQSFTRVSLPHLRQSPQWSYGGELLEVIRFTSPTVGGAQPLIDGDEPALSWEQKFAREVASIEALPFVKGEPGVSVSEKKANLNKVYVSVWCCWEKSRKSFKQVCVACDEDLRPTHLEALRELRLKLIREHGHPEHVIDTRAAERRSAIEAEAALELGSQDGPPTACSASERAAVRERASAARNALDFMMAGSQLRSKREAAERARKVAELEANMALREAKMKQNEAVCAREAAAAALAHVEALQQEMGQLKRVRNGGASEASEGGADGVGGSHLSEDESSESSDEGEGGEQCGSPPDWSTWTIKKLRKLESLAHKRRSVQIDSSLDNDRSAPPRGDERRSWRWHWRRGLVGTMQDWAEGRRHRLVHMLVEMARYFKVQNEVASGMGFGLTQEEVEALKVDKHIVDRICEALAQLKQCRSEEEQMDYHTVLAVVAPKREAQRDQGGKIRSFSERVARGARYVKGEMRLYVFDQAIIQRAKFDEMAARGGPLKVGDEATSRGQPCSVVEIDYKADTCTLRFSAGGVEATSSYSCIYKGEKEGERSRAPFPPGSARLRRAPPSLRPKGRETRSDERAEVARPKVEEVYCAEGARSPLQKDCVHRRLGRHLFETAQALIVYAASSALYKVLCERFPDQRISLATFRRLCPWYVRRAKEESCLCKQCDNFKQQMSTLRTVADVLQPLLDPPCTADGEDTPANDNDDPAQASGWSGAGAMKKLIDICRLGSKSAVVKAFLCEGAFVGAGREQCINDGDCRACGMKTIWSEGLRRHVVGPGGNVLQTAPVQFQTVVKWVRIKSSKEKDANQGKDTRYDARQGTIDPARHFRVQGVV